MDLDVWGETERRWIGGLELASKLGLMAFCLGLVLGCAPGWRWPATALGGLGLLTTAGAMMYALWRTHSYSKRVDRAIAAQPRTEAL